MFREIDARVYLMVDGDDTYGADRARDMAEAVLSGRSDMVVGDRLSSTYFTENKRPFHNMGNSALRFSINCLFHSDIRDIMTGCRAFSYEFVKTIPILSEGFEIETEMTIHALNKNMSVSNVVIPYRDRPVGSHSKLNTFKDGFKIIKTVIAMHKNYRPLAFFGFFAAVLLLLCTGFFIPVLITYLKTGLVPKFPTLMVCGFTAIAALLSFFTGLQLQGEVKKNRCDFELERIRASRELRKMLDDDEENNS